jgi:ribose 1,5-bisphosphokinase
VIREVRDRLAHDTRFVFPRRIVTREASGAEDHASTTPADFEARLRRGAFALHWQAHGLHYAIPAQIDDAVRCGSTIMFNASRHAAPLARSRYSNAAVVIIDAPLEVRAARLTARGREHGEDIAGRLVRLVPGFSTADADFVIDNTGTVARAADLLMAWLRARHPT